MRTTALAATAALLFGGSAALAAPAAVSVTVGPELQKEAVSKYGVSEVDRLAETLKRSVERELARTGAYADGRVDLVLTAATPNRPTFEQLSRRPGLSFRSFGVGGAAVEGQATDASGRTAPVDYSWYETDIRQAPMRSTWDDAEWVFQRFASRLSRGQELAVR